MAGEDKTLRGLAVLVTGGGSGIGRAIALAFAAQGASVAVAGRRRQPLLETVASLERFGVEAAAIDGDVSRASDARDLVERAAGALGALHVVINNAGAAHQGTFADTPEEQVHRLIDINLEGPIFVIQAALPHLARHATERTAAILNITSSVTQAPVPGYSIYAAAKAGLESLTRNLALELAPRRIRVNAISPGVVETPIFAGMLGDAAAREMLGSFGPHVPLGRVGHPDDIARMAVVLCDPRHAWVTGAIVAVDGGLALGTV
jgi:NAD(P)-dependent dehydrogenase (short-subunit alcohol dehydrogenase family)